MGFFRKMFGSYSDREELRAKTEEFKARYQSGETLDDLLPEAFAAVREASWRVLGMRPFRVQLIGGIVLHQGRIAEMKTGEGQNARRHLPAYLNALTGEGVHIVTVNDYLAKRDSEWMGKVYRFMGTERRPHRPRPDRRRAPRGLRRDITYGTNNEMGFDYLRDNMAIYRATWCSAATPSPSWTRWTPSSSTRRARRSSSPVRATSPPSCTPADTSSPA